MIKVIEEFRIPGTDIIIEKGDSIKVQESVAKKDLLDLLKPYSFQYLNIDRDPYTIKRGEWQYTITIQTKKHLWRFDYETYNQTLWNPDKSKKVTKDQKILGKVTTSKDLVDLIIKFLQDRGDI